MMIRSALFSAATALALFSTAAHAETIALDRSMQAQSLHEGNIDMVVFFLERDDHYEVVATYASKAAPETANRIRMGLIDGDVTQFSLPGERGISYVFQRDGNTVSVTSGSPARKVAELVQ